MNNTTPEHISKKTFNFSGDKFRRASTQVVPSLCLGSSLGEQDAHTGIRRGAGTGESIGIWLCHASSMEYSPMVPLTSKKMISAVGWNPITEKSVFASMRHSTYFDLLTRPVASGFRLASSMTSIWCIRFHPMSFALSVCRSQTWNTEQSKCAYRRPPSRRSPMHRLSACVVP